MLKESLSELFKFIREQSEHVLSMGYENKPSSFSLPRINYINPAVMVVAEVEANHNATSFLNRFTEALFYFSTYFYCVETYMQGDDVYFGQGIRNIVAMEGAERKVRNVTVDVWRAFFDRFGMVKKVLSMSSLYQAHLLTKRFACGSSCTFGMNNNCPLIGWKALTTYSLTATLTCLRDVVKFDKVSSLFPPGEPMNHKQYHFPAASLEHLRNHTYRFKGLHGEGKIQTSDDLTDIDVGKKLSAEDIMRIAGTRFIQSSPKSYGWESLKSDPNDSCFTALSDQEKGDIELAESLLASAEKVGHQQFERGRRLITLCDSLSSKTGNAVERVVYYFSEALRQRIDRETGRLTSDGGKKQSFDPDEFIVCQNPSTVACHEELPFSQVADYCGVQALIENVTEAKKIHVIDFGIRKGAYWAILMQALGSRDEFPLELLKVTAVGTSSKESLEETGNRLMNFAHTMNIPFSFKIVMVPDMLNLKETLFELDPEETVAVFSKFSFRSMLPQPDQLESIMKVIRNINTTVMVVTEVEARHNATSFVNRFTEALFYFSALFDCIENCMKRDNPNRIILESQYFSHGIRNIVAAEGGERRIRHVKIDVWRAFFSRFGMVESELSMSSLFQADLVAKRFARGSSCTLEMNGNCLLIGWKGTPLCSLSVWKFL